MTKMRPTSDHQRERLKGATGEAIDRAGGGTFLATRTRVETGALSKYRAGHETDYFMPVDIAADTDLAAGRPIILATLASVEGYQITPLSCAPGGTLTPALVGRLIRETADVSAAILDAQADGRVSINAKHAIMREIDEALAVLWQTRAALNEDGQ